VLGEPVEKYRFDDFELMPRQRVLLRAGSRIPLTPKPLSTLLLLVARAGQTVTKEELFEEVWNGAVVEENNLTQSISALRKALGEKRGENRYIVTDPSRGYRFVAPVSHVPEEAAAPSNGSAPPRSRVPSLPWAIGGLLLLASVMAVGVRYHQVSVRSVTRPSIAVLRVRDLSKNSTEAWLQTALPEMLTSEIAAGNKLRTVPPTDVARWRADAGGANDNESQSSILQSARTGLGADTVVLGTYVVTGTCPACRIRVDLGVIQARTGERLGTVIEEGSAADLLDLTTRLGHGLRAQLGLKNEVASTSKWPAASGMREYSEGLASLRQGDPLAARQHLEAAVAADPQNALIHSALAETWTALGYGIRAMEEDKRAYELAGTLDRLDRLGLEARYRASLKDWDRAIEIYQTIFKLFPDSLNDGLNLAVMQSQAQHVPDAKATLNQLRRLPKPAGNDPRIDLAEARAVGTLNDFTRTRALAHAAAEEAQARGARYLYAKARLLEGGAMQNMAAPNAIAVQDEARKICEAIGDRNCVSQAWRIRGNYLYYTGEFQAAQEAYAQGVAIARELGNNAELANLLVGYGVVEKVNRNWPQAERNFQEAISLKLQVGFNPNEVRNELAELYLTMGSLKDADRLLQFEETTIQRAGAHEDSGDMLMLEAALARLHGQLDRAQQLADRGVTELRLTGDPAVVTAGLAQRSSIYTAQGKLAEAGQDLADASDATGPENVGARALSRAELSIANSQFQAAAQEAEKAAEAYDKAHLDDLATQAFVTAADAFDMSGRPAEALAACGEAGKRAALTPNELASAMALVCSWRLSAGNLATIPAQLLAKIGKMANPEMKLTLDYARAIRMRRAGAANYRAVARELAAEAAKLGQVTLSRRAESLVENPSTNPA
jgi:DNA-binding winged helix-turn-helix (wHTH) protein/tetratricopeptide (TPR) repeat protein